MRKVEEKTIKRPELIKWIITRFCRESIALSRIFWNIYDEDVYNLDNHRSLRRDGLTREIAVN